jgi:hypothetical protein
VKRIHGIARVNFKGEKDAPDQIPSNAEDFFKILRSQTFRRPFQHASLNKLPERKDQEVLIAVAPRPSLSMAGLSCSIICYHDSP